MLQIIFPSSKDLNMASNVVCIPKYQLLWYCLEVLHSQRTTNYVSPSPLSYICLSQVDDSNELDNYDLMWCEIRGQMLWCIYSSHDRWYWTVGNTYAFQKSTSKSQELRFILQYVLLCTISAHDALDYCNTSVYMSVQKHGKKKV